MITGIDVSRWQDGLVDWHVVAANHDFAYLRIAYGLTPDAAFAREWDLARAVRRRGVYLYLRPEQGARVQAEWCVELLSYAGACELPPVIDVEEGKPLPADVAAWLRVVEWGTGQTPAIYGSALVLPSLIGADPSWARHPLWVADYGRAAGSPRVPSPWRRWWLHQWTGSGTSPGVRGPVDLNVECP